MAATVLAACLGIGTAPAAPPAVHGPAGFAAADAASTVAFVVSDVASNDVYAYGREGRLVATISGLHGPRGVAIGAAGELYVANASAANVVVYKNDYKTRLAVLADTGEVPVSVSYDASSGTVAVVNVDTRSHPANVTFYARGQTKPCVRLTNSTFASAYYGAFDNGGTFYFDGYDKRLTVRIGQVSGGCRARAIGIVTTSNTVGAAGGIAVKANGDIALADARAIVIYTYKPPHDGSLGAPVAATPLHVNFTVGAFAFANDEQDVWTVDFGNQATYGYHYPAGGSPVHSTGQLAPSAVAVTPLGRGRPSLP